VDAEGPGVIEEIKRAGDWGLDPSAFDITKLSGAPELTDRALANAEMRLSLAVLKYARHARGGRIEDPATRLSSYLDRIPQVRRPWRVIAEIARGCARHLSAWAKPTARAIRAAAPAVPGQA
jgi:L,D-transpeptidase YcbB